MTASDQPPSQYRSFLLRLWLEDPHSACPLRIVLIDPLNGHRHGFVDFVRMVSFLTGEMAGEGLGDDQEEDETLSQRSF